MLFWALLVSVLALAASKIPGKSEDETYGIVMLDSVTFPKIVPLEKFATVVLVYNKGQVGDYATDSMREDYFNLANKGTFIGNSEGVLFAQVVVNGAQNKRLAEKMGIPANFVHPRLVLFKPGSVKPILYPESGAFNEAALSQFVSKHTNFFYQLPGLIERLDVAAEKLMAAHPIEFDPIIDEAKVIASTVAESFKEHAAYYLKTMEKVKEAGKDFVNKEISRLEKLLENTNLSGKKKDELNPKLNILKQFDRPMEAEF